MQKKIKKLIILLIVIVLILGFIIFIISDKINNGENSQQSSQLESEREGYEAIQNDPSIIINGEKLGEITSEATYMTISQVIDKYIAYISQNNADAIYSVMYDGYKAEKNITQENVLQFVERYDDYKIIQMNGISTINYGIYYIKIKNNENNQFLMLNWDTQNNTFSICPIEETQYNEGLQVGIKVDKERITSIEKNDYNKVTIFKTDNESIAKKYFYDFIEILVNNTSEAYELLDEEYKKVNFATYNDFLEYVNNNKVKLQSLDRNNFKDVSDFTDYEEYEQYYQQVAQNKMKNYSQTSENGVKTYIFEDSYGKYYMFKVTAAMEYTVMMDTYTMPSEDFIKQYDDASEPEKVILNIKKFFMGIDDKNYGYSYNLLSEGFKNNNYPTKNDFVNYAKQNFFEENEIEYISYEKENNLFIYKIKLTDATGSSSEQKSFNMIVKLNNGTDFEMSFGEE